MKRCSDAYRRGTGSPINSTVHCGLVTAPDGATKMVAVPLCHCGEPAQAETDVRPLRELGTPLLDELGPLPYVAHEPLVRRDASSRAFNYWKSAFFRELSGRCNRDLAGVLRASPSA